MTEQTGTTKTKFTHKDKVFNILENIDYVSHTAITPISVLDLANGHYSVVFTSIEMLCNKKWHTFFAEEKFTNAIITVIAFDEVHTMIDWATFRPKYTNIPDILANINPDIPLNLLTATCPPNMKKAILDLTGISQQQLSQVAVIPNRYF